MKTKMDIEPLLTTADVATILKCSPDHVADLHYAGKIPAAGLALKPPGAGRPGRKMLRFRPADIRSYIDAQMVVPSAEVAAVVLPPQRESSGPSLLRGKG